MIVSPVCLTSAIHAVLSRVLERTIMSFSAGKSTTGSSVDTDGTPGSTRSGFSDISGEFQLDGSHVARTMRKKTALSALPPQKRKNNDLSELTIDKLNFDSLSIYGREREILILKDAYHSLVEATSERRLVLISGTSGSGKSKLAETIQSQTVRNGGLYVKGKFDLNMRNEPYCGVAGACAEICGSIVELRSKDPSRSEMICEDIRRALGLELELLIQAIPVIGEIAIPDLDGRSQGSAEANLPSSSGDSKDRIHFAFLRLFRIVSKHFDPLVIVLDDLQWSDACSLDLLEVLMSDLQNPKFMVIGTYRSNELGETHIFHKSLQELESKSLSGDCVITKIEVHHVRFRWRGCALTRLMATRFSCCTTWPCYTTRNSCNSISAHYHGLGTTRKSYRILN